MTVENIVHLVAGFMVLLSISLAYFVHPYWIALAAFVGFNLMQSGVTNFCPLSSILKKAGVQEGGCS
jgi:hypothetical protein